jgi:hypothetical protein
MKSSYLYGIIILVVLVVLIRMKNLGIISNREWNLIFLCGWIYLIFDSFTNKLYKGKMRIFMIIISILVSFSYLYKVITNKNYLFKENNEGFHNYAKVNFDTNKKEKLKDPAIQPIDGVRVNYYVSKLESLVL